LIWIFFLVLVCAILAQNLFTIFSYTLNTLIINITINIIIIIT
jgi:hypothetical protein